MVVFRGPYYRIMMKAAPGYRAECWAECRDERQIYLSIAEMRAEFGPTEPARVMYVDANGKQTLHLVDDPAKLFAPGEAEAPIYEFGQVETGATMPAGAKAAPGTCESCGRKGNVVQVLVVGMGQRSQKAQCAECVTDMAFGGMKFDEVSVTVEHQDGGFGKLIWKDGPSVIPPPKRR